ncbi:MAG TPA: ribulose-phosphate 3-epimerase [Firmicutes bacterium]|nr:ribulose-phosphate 3-epimerase [Bacillota bacterium]
MRKGPVRLAPSILSADFSCLAKEVQEVEAGGADWLHLDVMDGAFVPNITFGVPVVAAVRAHTRLPLDVHLMIERPELYVADFCRAGADLITVHVETAPHLHRLVTQIKGAGAAVGVALNPATPLSTVAEILPDIDLLLIMTVNPGFGGQSFIPSGLDKLRRAAELLARKAPGVLLEVDGGITEDNARQVVQAGAEVLVAGSAVFGQPERKAALTRLRQAIEA